MIFAIIGNDKRMDYIAERLYALGCEVSRDLNSTSKDIVLVLAPPVTDEDLKFIIPHINNVSRIYGGNIKDSFLEGIRDVEVFDYLSWDNVISENANLTAKGIIKEAIHYNCIFDKANILVTGYGYCGKAIARELQKYNTNISIAIRNSKLKNQINNEGFEYIDIRKIVDSDLNRFDYIFNTVPALIFDNSVIDFLSKKVMIFDIASKPGGVDFEYCKQKNIFALLSLGIPGRIYPEEAGQIIANACFNHYFSI